jgi:pyridoxal phosphate enzyme (YggS family)
MFHYEKAWQDVRSRIARAASVSGRDPDSVRLVAVSKTFPAAAVRAVHALGQRDFGENYVQEGAAKMAGLSDLTDIRWHLIGPLQSNKTALAASSFAMIQTVDRAKIATRLSAARSAGMPDLDVCIQVNVSGEDSKSGIAPPFAVGLAATVAALPGLRLRGIMGIPEPTPDVRMRRSRFRQLRDCFDECRGAGLPMDTLSMGMSADLEDAIAEGSTLVRVGTAIFGARDTIQGPGP